MASIPFCQMVRASGLAEPWTHVSDNSKFDQYGWRCTTNENGFSNCTLLGNHAEERFDLKQRLMSKSLPSQYNHYFVSTYDHDYNKGEPSVPAGAKNLKRLHPRSFPGHQPELDTNAAKAVYNDWNTTSTASYRPPKTLQGPQNNGQTRKPIDRQSTSNRQIDDAGSVRFLGVASGPPANGGYVISAPHAGPGTGLGAHQRSCK